MKIYIAADHAGYEMKQKIIRKLHQFEFTDLGTHSTDAVDYPDYAIALADQVIDHPKSIGILICGTGIGMCISANKVHGIRCANVTSEAFAKLAKEHNDANVIALSSRFVSLDENIKIIKNFINAKFEAKYEPRIKKIDKISK
ncbi:MAG: RpiB/LacA/LacB family sugar-phosphate isomerase [Mycoplasmoidaceae bacterium]